MADNLKDLFSATCQPELTKQTVQELDRFRAIYEVRDTNPMAFNTPLLGVTKGYWYPKDTEAIFDIFRIDKNEFIRCIKVCPRVDKKFNVTSNEFNLLIIWLVYCLHQPGPQRTLSMVTCRNACLNLLKLLNYKFFCGKVSSSFPYNAKPEVAQYTIDHLSAKSDIKLPETDTWKKMIYKHCEIAMAPGSIYANTFKNFYPDVAVLKSISDIHTRLCRKIVLVAEAYYENNAKGNRYTTSDLMIDDAEKGKVLADLQGTLDIVISRLQAAALNINEFVDNNYAKLAAKLASNTRTDMITSALISFSAMATQQVHDKTSLEVSKDKQKNVIFTGYAKLIEEIVQKTYRRAAITGVDLKNNLAILQLAKNIFTASRVNDPELLAIKNSFDHFVQTHTKYTRQGTLIGIRLGLMLYLILLSFKYR